MKLQMQSDRLPEAAAVSQIRNELGASAGAVRQIAHRIPFTLTELDYLGAGGELRNYSAKPAELDYQLPLRLVPIRLAIANCPP